MARRLPLHVLKSWLGRPSGRPRLGVEALEDRTTPAVYTVTGLADGVGTVAPDGAGGFTATTLRAAITAADAASDPDTIVFAPALTATDTAPALVRLVGDTTFGPSGFIIRTPITIRGTTTTGENGVRIQLDLEALGGPGSTANRFRLFYVTPTGSLTLNDLTVADGLARGGNGLGGGGAAGMGGGVLNAGTLVVQQSLFFANFAWGGGSNAVGNGGPGGGGGLGGDGSSGAQSGGGPNRGLVNRGQEDGGFGGGGNGTAGYTGPAGTSGTVNEVPSAYSLVGRGGFGGGGGYGFGFNFDQNASQYTGGAGGFGAGGGGGGHAGGAGGFGGGAGTAAPAGGRGFGGGGAGLGGAIFNYGGVVEITNSTFTSNSAAGGTPTGGNSGKAYGGAVFNLNGTLTVLNSTLAQNFARDGGGAVYSLGSGGENTQGGPPLPVREAVVTLNNSILSNSRASGQTADVNDYFAATTPGTGSAGRQSSRGTNNIIVMNSGFTGSNTIATAPGLVLFPSAYGGPTRTLALAAGSPAINAGSNTAALAAGLVFDQRGLNRIAGGVVDIGAFESGAGPILSSLVVDSAADADDGDYSTGHLSLREAVKLANDSPDPSTITFAPALVASGPASILLDLVGDTTFGATGLAITSPVTIQGPTGANGVTIAKSPGFLRLFYVAPIGSLTLQDITVAGGYAQGRSGGRYDAGGGLFVYSNGGGAAGLGGGILNAGTLNLVRTTMSGNHAEGAGGGYGLNSGPGQSGGGGGLGVTTAGGDADGTAGGGPNGGSSGGGAGGFGGGGGAGGGAGGFGSGGGGGGPNGGQGGFGGGGGNSPGTLKTVPGPAGVGGFGGGNRSVGAGMGGGGGAGMGGAIFNYGGTVTITDSTLNNNVALAGLGGPGATDGKGYGGAVFNLNGTVTILNSTLADNLATNGGGAVFSLSSAGEDTQAGPALPVRTPAVSITNSILAYSKDRFGGGGQEGGPIALPVSDYAEGATGTGATAPASSGGFNIIQRNGGFDGASVQADPLLGPMDYYGGPTASYSLRSGSPAIDAGTPIGAPATDQRGQPRPQGAGVDLGAFEVIAPPVAVAVGPTSISDGRIGTAYPATQLTATGPNAVFTFAVTAGTLPAGLTLTADGVLSGTPTVAGAFGFTVTASSTAGSGSRAFVFTVTAPPSGVVALSPATLPAGTVGSGYSQTIFAAPAASGPFTFAVTAGALPPGLTLSAGGRVEGTPTAAGTFSFTVAATAATGGTGHTNYVLDITSAPVPPAGPRTIHLLVERRAGGLAADLVVRNPDGSFRFDLSAFQHTWSGDINLAVGDLNGDGVDDVAVGAGLGGAPRLEVYDGATGTMTSNGFMFDATLTGGVKVAIAGDGLVVTPGGTGVAPHVRVIKGGTEVASFYAFAQSFLGGVNVASGEVTGDEVADVVFGAGTGGGPAVLIFDGASGTFRAAYFVGPDTDRGGAEVRVRDPNGDGRNEVIARAAGQIRAFDPLTGADISDAFDPTVLNAVFG